MTSTPTSSIPIPSQHAPMYQESIQHRTHLNVSNPPPSPPAPTQKARYPSPNSLLLLPSHHIPNKQPINQIKSNQILILINELNHICPTSNFQHTLPYLPYSTLSAHATTHLPTFPPTYLHKNSHSIPSHSFLLLHSKNPKHEPYPIL